MENEEYTKVRIDDSWGMNVFNEALKIEIFYNHEGNWKPVFKIQLMDDFSECFLIYLYGDKDRTVEAYPFKSKKLLQQLVIGYVKQLYNVNWRLPSAVTDILDSWLLIRSMT